MATNVNPGFKPSSKYSLHNVSKIYTQCISIIGSPRDAKTHLFLSLYAGYALHSLLNEKRMKKKKFVTTLLDDQLDFLVTFNLAHARRCLKTLKGSKNPELAEINQLEEVVGKVTNLYFQSFHPDIIPTNETLNEYAFNRIWEYVHGKLTLN